MLCLVLALSLLMLPRLQQLPAPLSASALPAVAIIAAVTTVVVAAHSLLGYCTVVGTTRRLAVSCGCSGGCSPIALIITVVVVRVRQIP